jgi:hypothetical protein
MYLLLEYQIRDYHPINMNLVKVHKKLDGQFSIQCNNQQDPEFSSFFEFQKIRIK